mgnify:CR=1 FL=1
MHENQGNSVIYYAHYTEGGVNKTGLTVTIDVYEVIRDGTATLVVNDGACTEIGAGLYRYLLASSSVDAAAEYIGVFHTATDTVDAQDIPAMWVIDRAGTEKLDNGVALEATLTAIKGAGWTTETLVAIDVLIDAIKAKTDALDVSDITVVATVDGSTLTILRGDTWDDAHLLNLCDLTDYVSIDFIVKESKAHTDDDAIIHIRKNASGTGDGLLRLNKAAYATATDGAITIEDIPTGDITPTLKATATKDLVPGSYIYDIQVITATSVKTRTSGVLKVMSDVTRLVA